MAMRRETVEETTGESAAGAGGGAIRAAALCAAAIAAGALASGCGLHALREPAPVAGAGVTLRILVDGSAPEARLTADEPIRAETAAGTGRAFADGLLVLAKGSALTLVDLVSGEEWPAGSDALVLTPGGAPLRANGRPYRGAISVTPAGTRTVRIVNHVEIEDYLLGVVPAEIGHRAESEIEAVKAQAVAARTYALAALGQYGAAGFDLFATAQDQVYAGVAGEDSVAARAVRETAGLVLLSRGELARAYYSSTCGGRTAAVTEVWDKPPAPYLRGGADRSARRGSEAAFCAASPYFAWTEEWDAPALDRTLAAHLHEEVELGGKPAGHLTGIKVITRGRSGRVVDLELRTTTGRHVVSGDRIRWVLRRDAQGDPILRSTLIRVDRVERKAGRVRRLVISGRGNGHGVGMCQTGAIGMAEIGYSFRDILRHYYRSVDVRPYSDAREVPAALAVRDVVRRILAWTGPPSSGSPNVARR
jgi:stage II sporulation protein D